MVDGKLREIRLMDSLIHVHFHAVHYAVLSSAEDQSFHIRQSFELIQRSIMRINLTVHSQSTHRAGNTGILRTSQIQNHYHILLQNPSSISN